jgi:hypothetical protein
MDDAWMHRCPQEQIARGLEMKEPDEGAMREFG